MQLKILKSWRWRKTWSVENCLEGSWWDLQAQLFRNPQMGCEVIRVNHPTQPGSRASAMETLDTRPHTLAALEVREFEGDDMKGFIGMRRNIVILWCFMFSVLQRMFVGWFGMFLVAELWSFGIEWLEVFCRGFPDYPRISPIPRVPRPRKQTATKQSI